MRLCVRGWIYEWVACFFNAQLITFNAFRCRLRFIIIPSFSALPNGMRFFTKTIHDSLDKIHALDINQYLLIDGLNDEINFRIIPFPVTIWKKIRENMDRTRIEGKCRWPQKKAIEMPQSPSKSFIPRKYVVHQCSDDTACCGSNDKTCIAKQSDEIELWFTVRMVSTFRSVDWHLGPQEEANYGTMMIQNSERFLEFSLHQTHVKRQN